MNNYIDVSLDQDEQILYKGELSLWSFYTHYLVGSFLLLVGLASTSPAGSAILLFVGVAIFVYIAYVYFGHKSVITNKRVISQSTFLRPNLVELDLQKIKCVKVGLGLRGRIFNYGTVVFTDNENHEVYIDNIRNPVLFREELITAQENNRSQNYQ